MNMAKIEDRCVREALQYKKIDWRKVDCFLCAHRCRIASGRRGICRVRENRDDALYTLVYGRLIAANVDPIEKKPLYHFQPGSQSYSIATMGCNFNCDFCQNASISQANYPERLAGSYAEPQSVVDEAERHRCSSIAYTYTEPTIFFEYARDVASIAHERGIKNVFVTNGYQTPETIDKMAGLVDAANIDLKSFDDEFYRKLCGASLAPVLEAIRLMHENGIFVELTTLLITGENDSDGELKQLAGFIADISPDIPWHVSAFYPTHRMLEHPPTQPNSIYKALEIGEKAGLRYLYAGNIPGSGYEDTKCHSCGKTVIYRTGFSVRATNLDGGKCGHCGTALPLVV